MSNQVNEAGRMITSASTGSVVNLVPGPCKLLGFFAGASTTLSIYDTTGTSATNIQGFAISACAVGWNRLPIELLVGLSINQGAQLNFVVAA